MSRGRNAASSRDYSKSDKIAVRTTRAHAVHYVAADSESFSSAFSLVEILSRRFFFGHLAHSGEWHQLMLYVDNLLEPGPEQIA